ncbi:putative 26S proteasome regulatory subunit rpn3 [Obelidium mucronatum]|nr:putative 26S proteasome regulatory subunit rpn3 [Obelidium mucronatum]
MKRSTSQHKRKIKRTITTATSTTPDGKVKTTKTRTETVVSYVSADEVVESEDQFLEEADTPPSSSKSIEPIESSVESLAMSDSGAKPVAVEERTKAQTQPRSKLVSKSQHRMTTPEDTKFVVAENALRKTLERALKQSAAMDVDAAAESAVADVKAAVLPEVEVYLGFLALLFLHDSADNATGLTLASELFDYVQKLNRRSLDQISAKIYFYYERFFEIAGRLAEIRPHDNESQAVLLNLLLRNYIHFNLYDQADKLVSKTVFPEEAGNSQSARYFYYLGRIKAIQLDYTASHRDLVQAIRKAPKNPKSAGFQQAVHKLAIIVQLLTGEIPERSLFREPFLIKSLVPYLSITQAVRIGDLAKFQETLAKHTATFRADKTYTLILRLRHNVIKTGIRMISLAYSKISLRDICLKLQLDSEEDAEYIVAKSIRDGVIDAVLDHENGFMKSKVRLLTYISFLNPPLFHDTQENVDIYSTNEPQNAFHQRISFCLNLHNESVKALRFPYAQRKETSSMEAIREEERLIAGELAEGDLDDDDMGDF